MPSGEMVCPGCILQLFEAALKFDHRWPAKWAGKVLQIEDFVSILEPEFLARLLWKRTGTEREAERLAGLNPSGLYGQERGQDYQYCPTCKDPICLIDGCNHITCRCGASFCYKCGANAEGDSRHWEWNVGCPQYGNEHLPQDEEEEEEEVYSATAWRDRLIRINSEFSGRLGDWAWNFAMQNSDFELRSHMSNFSTEAAVAMPAREHWLPVVNAMMAFSSSHGVMEERWTRILTDDSRPVLHRWEDGQAMPFGRFLYPAGGERPTGPEFGRLLNMAWYLDLYRGMKLTHMLREPVADMFDFSFGSQRLRAIRWIVDRLNADTTDFSGPENYAVIACGPGGTAASRLLGAEILATLHSLHGRSRIYLPNIQRGVTFTELGSGSILMHVYDERIHVDELDYHILIAMQDQLLPWEEQGSQLWGWLRELFTDPWDILTDVRETFENVADAADRPATLYLCDEDEDEESDEESDDEEMEDYDDGTNWDFRSNPDSDSGRPRPIPRNLRITFANETVVGDWAWNVAMQNAGPDLRAHLSESVLPEPDDIFGRGVRPAREHWLPVIQAMLAFSETHGITEEEWTRIVNRNFRLLPITIYPETEREMLNLLYAPGSDHPTGRAWARLSRMASQLLSHLECLFVEVVVDPEIFSGHFLRQPISGVFNLNVAEGRRNAAIWMHERMHNGTTTDNWREPENYAIFACGPGGRAASRRIGAELCVTLEGSRGYTGIHLPGIERTVTFTFSTLSDVIVHVSDAPLHFLNVTSEDDTASINETRFRHLAVMNDASSMSRSDQDDHLERWMWELFTDPERIFIEVREAAVNGTRMDPPSTLYLGGDLKVVRFDSEPMKPDRDSESDEDDEMTDAGVGDSDDEEIGEHDGEFANDEDVEMVEVDGEDEGHQEVAEKYVRYHLRSSVDIARR
jgi:hypothetical protein